MSWIKTIFHRHIWQRTPRLLRRRVLAASAGLIGATRRRRPLPGQGEPVTVAGVLASASGLGESARLSYRALQSAGIKVDGLDLSGSLMGEKDIVDFRWNHPAPGAAGTMIIHVNPFPLPLAMARLPRGFVRQKRVIGYFAWELPRAPAIWRHGMRHVDEIWVPSRFVAEALRPMAGDRPIRIVPHPLAVEDRFAHQQSDIVPRPERPFTILTMFNMRSSFERKNPLAAIAAFRGAFGDAPDVRLLIKVINATSFPPAWQRLQAAAADNITLIDGALPASGVTALYLQADVVVSLHRAEGFGLLVAEAMLAGKPVIATDYSGSRDFLEARNGMPIPYRLVPALDPQGEYDMPSCLWAEPDVEAAAAAMRRLYDDPGLRRSLGASARRDALQLFDPMRYAAVFRDALKQQ